MKKVDQIVKEMSEGKSLGIDEFTTNFFQTYYKTIGKEVWEVVEESITSGTILQDFNSTFLTLIPKEKQENEENKYSPISLGNVMYKIISKVVSNHLNPIMNSIISPQQGGFIEGRKIINDIILAHESIHYLKMKKNLGMLIKLDMSKLYDRLN